MPEILTNTGAKLWSKDDYSELWLSVFEELTGTGGKSNIRLIDEAIGNINSALDGYYLLYENDRLYMCKDGESSTDKLPISLIDSDGHTASTVDGTSITIDEYGVIHGATVDSAFSLTSENAIQNKVVKAKFDSVDKAVSDNTSALAVLNGTGTGSVAKIAEDTAIAEVAKVVANAPEDFDTLKEMSDWIAGHENDATAMNSAIQTNTTDIATLKSGKVDKVSGKGLSTNDYTTAEKSKLGGLNSTLLNKLGESSKGNLTFNGSEVNTNTDYIVDTVAEAQAAIDSGLIAEGDTIYVKEDSDTFTFKGSCLSTDLPSSGNSINDTYYCTDTKCRMTWNGGAWYQSSLSETEYVDELASLRNECEASHNELKGDLDNLIDEELELNMFFPLSLGRMNKNGIPTSSQKYGYTSNYFYAKKGSYLRVNDTVVFNMRIAKFNSKGGAFENIRVNIDEFLFEYDGWYRVDIEYSDSSVVATEQIFDNLKGYIFTSKEFAYVDNFTQLKNACENERITDIYLLQDIKAIEQIFTIGNKHIHGNGHTITGNNTIYYLLYINRDTVIIDNLVLIGAKDDVVYVGECTCYLNNCDISNSYENDGVGLHGSAICYIRNCKIHDNYDEGLSTHDTSWCEVINTETYKNGYVVGTDTPSNVSFGGLHFGGSKMGTVKNCYSHHNSPNGIAFATIDGNYSADAISICEGNITVNNTDKGIRFGGASNVRCVNNMCSDGILFYKKEEHSNDGYIGLNSANIQVWTDGDGGLIYLPQNN